MRNDEISNDTERIKDSVYKRLLLQLRQRMVQIHYLMLISLI